MANETEIGKLVLRLVAEVSDLKKGLQDSKKDVKDFTDSSKKDAQGLGGTIGDIKAAYLGYVAAIYSAWQTVKKVMDWAEIGARAQAVEESFSILTRSLQINGQALASQIREASFVFVEQTGLMVKAQRLLIEGVDPTQVVKLTEASRVAARLMGVDVEEAFNRISEAVITLRTRGLKAAFPMDVTEVTENYAKSLGTVAKYLSEAGQRQAIVNEILRQAAEKTDLLGGKLEPNLSEKIQKIKSGWGELQEVLGKQIGIQIEPVINALVDMITMIEKAQRSWQSMPEVIKIALREIAVTAAMAIPGVGPLIAQAIRASQFKAAAAAAVPEKGLAEVMAEQDAAIAAGLKAQENANKNRLINERKLQEDLTKFRLANTEQRAGAENEIIKSNLEAQKGIEVAAMKREFEDTSVLELQWDKKMAQADFDATMRNLKAKRNAEVEAAAQSGMDVLDVRKKYHTLEEAARAKLASQIAVIDANMGLTFEAMYGMTERELEDRLQRSRLLREGDYEQWRKEAKEEELHETTLQQLAAVNQIAENQYRITKEERLRSEIGINNELLAGAERRLSYLRVEDAGYAGLQKQVEDYKNKISELTFELQRQTATFGELIELGMKKYAVSLKENFIGMMENQIPNVFDTAGNSVKGFINNLVDGTMSATEALKQMADSFAKGMLNMLIDIGLLIAKMEILKALGYGEEGKEVGGIGTFNTGGGGGIFGTILSFIGGLFGQTGGLIHGPSGTDVVPVRATAGEFMHPVSAVQYYGLDIMEKLRSRSIPKDVLQSLFFGIPSHSRPSPSLGLASGGEVSSRAAPSPADKKTEITLINVIDSRDMDKWAASAAGQNAILNVLSSRMTTVKKIMR